MLFWASVAAADGLPRALTDADFRPADPAQAAIGRLLFYDKILSGNRNIACGTCHHPSFGTSDGLSLGIGEGGHGLGPDRVSGEGHDRIRRRVPRNAPALWNLGARDIRVLMHDGRISQDDLYGNGFNTPAEEWLPSGLNSVLAAQALFPMTAEIEMAGHSEENEVAGAVNDRIDRGWPIIAKRVRTLPEYGDAFVAAFDHIDRAEDVTIVEIANALDAFMTTEFRSHDSPFDRYLQGDAAAMDAGAVSGMELFFGKAGCSGCHSGPLLSSHDFRALSLPPFGPGRTRKFDLLPRDVGRMGESDDLADAYRFRVPMLRNVALTGPYGHNGAYRTLSEMIRHHLDPETMRAGWSFDDPVLPRVQGFEKVDFVVWQDPREIARQARARDTTLGPLANSEIEDLIRFLHALTSENALRPVANIPARVPSGLSVDRLPGPLLDQ